MLHFDISLSDLDFYSRSQRCEKAKTSAPIISQKSESIWMEFGVHLRLVSVMTLRLILSRLMYIQGRVLCSCDFVEKKEIN